MDNILSKQIDAAREAAIDVLRHNAKGHYQGLPRTAGWGYPEPYTRDLMIAMLGVIASGDPSLLEAWRNALLALAKNQTARGHIPSLAHDPANRGASDTTPLFLVGVALYRRASGDDTFLAEAAALSMNWMFHQSPDDSIMISQQPTTDWRDEQWVLGYGLYVNTLFYWALTLFEQHDDVRHLRSLINRLEIQGKIKKPQRHEGFAIPHCPFYALWAFKTDCSNRFDLLGNSLAILTGIASPTRAREMIRWVETQCEQLNVSLPPCLLPFIQPGDSDWRSRYEVYNRPGTYHNGGIWPFICGFYVAALVAANRRSLAQRKLADLTNLVKLARVHDVTFGFNEWFSAPDVAPRGEDWQTWSAAMYLYAVECVRSGETPGFVRRYDA